MGGIYDGKNVVVGGKGLRSGVRMSFPSPYGSRWDWFIVMYVGHRRRRV